MSRLLELIQQKYLACFHGKEELQLEVMQTLSSLIRMKSIHF